MYTRYYRIIKGDYLFRTANTTDVFDQMFFGFSANATLSSDSENKKIQLWQVQSDILPLYAVKHYKNEGKINEHKISFLPDIYKEKHPTDMDADFLTIKKFWNNPKRKLLTTLLLDMGIENWVTSVEDTYDMEVFLFGGSKKNFSLVKFVGYAKEDRKLYEYNYFDKARIKLNE